MGNGGFKCSQSDAINRCLEALADFEEHEGQDLVGWLEYKFQIYSKDKPNSSVYTGNYAIMHQAHKTKNHENKLL
jgi:hypothetical protein